MVLEKNGQGSLYCTFNEMDIKKYFSLSFDRFLSDREAQKKFSDILIRKSEEQPGTGFKVEGEVDVKLYQIDEESYVMCIENPKSSNMENEQEKKEYDVILEDYDISRLADLMNTQKNVL